MHLPHGSSKAHRPDLKQAVVERMVSQDGGVPLVSQRWDGNPSDTQGFQQRAEALSRAFQDTPSPRSLVADAKLYCETKAAPLTQLGFITRIPATRKLVSQVIGPALPWDTWPPCDAHTRSQSLALDHHGMVQRWLVVFSQAALERAEVTLTTATQRADEAIHTPLFHLQAQRLCTPTAAQAARTAWAKRWQYHQVAASPLTAPTRDAGQGRPTARTPLKALEWPS